MKSKVLNDKTQNNSVHNTFHYYDKDFYTFLKTASRGNVNKRIRFKDKSIKTMTPRNAITIKTYMDNNGLMYKNNKILLNNSSIIEYIICGNIKNYK